MPASTACTALSSCHKFKKQVEMETDLAKYLFHLTAADITITFRLNSKGTERASHPHSLTDGQAEQ